MELVKIKRFFVFPLNLELGEKIKKKQDFDCPGKWGEILFLVPYFLAHGNHIAMPISSEIKTTILSTPSYDTHTPCKIQSPVLYLLIPLCELP